MEKICTVLWKPEGVSDDAFRDALLSEAPELARAGAKFLRIDVVDGHVAAGTKVRVGRMDPPKSACVHYWVHEADARGPIEARLARRASKLAAFLVVESEPIRNTTQVAPPGGRTPGFDLVTCIEPKDGLPYDEFIRLWHEEHRVVAEETQSTFGYVRNEIVRALTPGAPASYKRPIRDRGNTMNFKPLHDRLLLEPITAETKTKAGIIIPDTAQEKPMQGKVVAVGKGKRLEDGRLQPLGVKVGDKVIYGKWSGTEVKLDGKDHVILKEEDLFGILG